MNHQKVHIKKDGSIFFTSRNAPITRIWIGDAFTKFGKYSQVQKKLNPRKII